jgi:hypothetical protein
MQVRKRVNYVQFDGFYYVTKLFCSTFPKVDYFPLKTLMHSQILADSSMVKVPRFCAKFKNETIVLSALFWSITGASTSLGWVADCGCSIYT